LLKVSLKYYLKEKRERKGGREERKEGREEDSE
jgi:hypothetical protein